MNKVYKKIFVYRPSENEVVLLKRIPYWTAIDSKASDEAFYDVWDYVNRSREIVVGQSIGGDFYQLSPAQYGTYIKESMTSMEYINRSKMRCALAHYMEEHHIPWEDFDD